MKKQTLVIVAVVAVVAFAAWYFFMRPEARMDTRDIGQGNATNRLTLALLGKLKGQ
jgi:hypothetical protein